ncbi:hypothetical protein KJ780_02345, partial [Candidatus Micrarchaeota archaeon]|nr:hypothetical protein [Candidatus Micrarchaeota archaeon]
MKWIIMIFALGLLAMPFAASESSDVVQLKYSVVECRMAALFSMIDYGEENTNLTTESGDFLKDDLITLQSYVDIGDNDGFSEFLSDTVNGHTLEAVEFLKGVRKEIVKGDHEIKPNVEEYSIEIIENRSICTQNAVRVFAINRLNGMGEEILLMNLSMQRLVNKSVDLDKMQEALLEADSNLQNLKDFVAQNNNTNLYEKVKEIRGNHLQIWARFQTERLMGILNA